MAFDLSTSTIALTFTGKLHDIGAQWQMTSDRRAAQDRIYDKIYERTFTELNQLEDHELADIGIRRINIAEIARDAAAKAV